MSDKEQAVRIKPNIDIPDLQRFGISDFQAGYDRFSPMEKNALWQTFMEVSLQVATGRSVSGRTYHKLLMMVQVAWPDVAIEDHIFDEFYAVRGVADADEPRTTKTPAKPPSTTSSEKVASSSKPVKPAFEQPGDGTVGPGDGPVISSGGKSNTPFSGLVG